jgi:hypothetical protein
MGKGVCSSTERRLARMAKDTEPREWHGKTTMTPEQEQACREEAERLADLPRDVQRKLIGQHRAIAADADVPPAARQEAEERADTLERHLRRLARKKRNSQ